MSREIGRSVSLELFTSLLKNRNDGFVDGVTMFCTEVYPDMVIDTPKLQGIMDDELLPHFVKAGLLSAAEVDSIRKTMSATN